MRPMTAAPTMRRHRPNETTTPPTMPPPSASTPSLMANARTAAESFRASTVIRSRGLRSAASSEAVAEPETPTIVTRKSMGALCVPASARARPITGARTAISVFPDVAGHARSSARNGGMS